MSAEVISSDRDPQPQRTQSDAAASYFNSRADTYELGQGSWHQELANDFLAWAKISTGQSILDLACGTGLCSILAATATGSTGKVVAADISSAMLEVARQKPVPEGSASIEWFEADISDLGHLSSIQRAVDESGFDLITCCSSFGYLPDRAGAVRHWLSLLKPGGRLICDVPTEDVTLQYVSGTSFRNITGIGVPFDRKWVKGIHSLEELLRSEGYSIEKSLKTKSYIPERWLNREELEDIFEKQLMQVADQTTGETWRAFFQTLMLTNEGKLKNSYAVYVTIGVKQAVGNLAT